MQSPEEVVVHWTEWVAPQDSRMGDRGVLYMYARQDEPLYIGKAASKTAGERYDEHGKDGVWGWIRGNVNQIQAVGIKLGYLFLREGRNVTVQKLRDVERLIIYAEAQMGRCRANITSTQSLSIPRSELVVCNDGDYLPLHDAYAYGLEEE